MAEKHDRSHCRSAGAYGFTLMELFVVLAIAAMISLAFVAAMGSIRAGDPMERASAEIRSLIQRGRAEALAGGARFELLVDFEHNRVHPYHRRQAALYNFEGPVGPFSQFIDLSQGGNIEDELAPRPGGNYLNLASPGSLCQIAHQDAYVPPSIEDGLVVSLDVYPRIGPNESGNIVGKGTQWAISMVGESRGVASVTARVRGVSVTSDVPLAAYTWGHVELVMTPSSLRLYVNNIPSLATPGNPLDLTGGGDTSPVIIGGMPSVPMAIDNLRIQQLVLGEPFELPNGAWLVPPGADPKRAVDLSLYDLPENETANVAGVVPVNVAPLPPLPLDSSPAPADNETGLPVRQALISFNERGQLDLNIHYGPLELMLAGRTDANFVYRHIVGISVMGVVEHWSLGDAPVPDETVAGPAPVEPGEVAE